MQDMGGREWLTVKQFQERNRNLGRNLIYDAVKQNQLPSIRIGGKILIPSDALGSRPVKWCKSASSC